MSEKKVVSRNVAIALGIICVVLAVGLVGAITNYTSIISGEDNTIATKDSQIQTLTSQKNQLQTWLDGNITYYNSQISSLNSQIADLQNQKNQLQTWLSGNITNYETQISSLNVQITDLRNQITDLRNQIDTLRAPKLIKVNLRADDVRHVYSWDPDDNLHVYGQICNVGTNWAYNCKLHVVAYQSGVVAIDTHIILGTIAGESWTSVDSTVYYSGSALTDWTITPEWNI
jgi:polyhydroxyalkanoate synthesis regulator phasin